MDKNEPKEMFVAFLDLLGFTAQLIEPIQENKENMNFAVKFYHELMTNVSKSMEAYMAIKRIAAPNGEDPAPEMAVKVMSDSMIFSAEDPIWMLVMITNAQKYFLTNNFAVRGAISQGLHWEQTESNVMQLVSPCFVDAYRLESKTASSARIVIDAKALKKLDLPTVANFGDHRSGMLVQCEDNLFAVNSMWELETNIGTEDDQDYIVAQILDGMRRCTKDDQKQKWAWIADLYNFQALRLHGCLSDKDWRNYYTNPAASAIPKMLADKLCVGRYCDYSDELLCRPSRFVDSQDLKKVADIKGVGLESLREIKFSESIRFLID